MNKTGRIFSILSLSFLLFGFLARGLYYFQNRSLFIDEANIARNIFEKNYVQLIGNLNYEQHAPPIFTWILKLICSVFDYSEYSLRLFPLLCGLLALYLFYRVSVNVLSPISSFIAVGLFAANSLLIQYSSEIKQYQSDALISVLFIYLFYVKENKRSNLFLIVVGTTMMWLSMPSIFFISALAIYLVVEFIRKERKLSDLLVVFFAWIVSFIILYYYNLSGSLNNNDLLEFHNRYFIRLPFTPEGWANFKELIIGFFGNVTGKSLMGVLSGMLFFSISGISFIRKREYKAILLVAPLFLCLLASFLQLYSLIPRLMCFSLAFIIILICKGIDNIIAYLSARFYESKVIKIASISILVFLGVISILTQDNFPFLNKRFSLEEIKPVLKYVKNESNEGSLYFIYHSGVAAFKYYTEIHPDKDAYTPPGTFIYGKWESDFVSLIKDAANKSDHLHWFIFDHFYGEDQLKLDNALKELQPPDKSIKAKLARAILY